MKTHREAFPEQYGHPLVGKDVTVRHQGKEIARGIVARVVQSRFGQLAHLENSAEKVYRLVDCTQVVGDYPSATVASQADPQGSVPGEVATQTPSLRRSGSDR